ncbi:MAG TPA: enoyl-CoA hydratase/isomerase family protein [Steroidobacter sp.]|uniref:enoyl-CoA hydratase/isomerase family protein n=1 Tax=Steroidobacter sp. TaxID=1978227 RepID=UPI002EDB3468
MAILFLDRPKAANTINLQLTIDVNDALDELDRDPSVRCILLTGAGDRHFCGGADLREIEQLISPEGVVGDSRRDFISHIEEVSKPVIAVINGAAMGGGCEIALACDFRVMADDARIGLPEVCFGALPGGGGTQRLPRLVGLAKAKELILTGRQLSAADALAIGLVDGTAPREQLMDAAQAMANQLADKAPYALAAGKRLLNQALELPLSEGLALERRVVRDMGTPQEREEFRERSKRASPTYESIFSPKAGANR